MMEIKDFMQNNLLSLPQQPKITDGRVSDALDPLSLVYFAEPLFLTSIFFAFFNPIAWNFLGRLEYRTQLLTRICGGRRYLACYTFAIYIFSIGIMRDVIYKAALESQPISSKLMSIPLINEAAWLCLIWGSILVLSSMWRLGITGTYLGDHFGILKSSRITSFPFNVAEHPMYHGSTLCFLSGALRMKSPAGLVLTGVVALAYAIAAKYEEGFTAKIYAKDAEVKKQKVH